MKKLITLLILTTGLFAQGVGVFPPVGGGSGSVETVDVVVVTPSATPVFTWPADSLRVIFTLTVDEEITSCTISNWPTGASFSIHLLQDGTGNFPVDLDCLEGIPTGAIDTAADSHTYLTGDVKTGVNVVTNISTPDVTTLQLIANTGEVITVPKVNGSTLANLATAQTMQNKVLGSGTTLTQALPVTAVAAPSTPAAGIGNVYVDSGSKNIAVKDDAGVVKHGIQDVSCSAGDFVSAVSAAGAGTCGTPSGSGGASSTTSGIGYFCLPFCGINGGAGTALGSKVAHFYQFVLHHTQEASILSFYPSAAGGTGCGGMACGFTAAIYDSACAKVSGSDFATTTTLTSAVQTVTAATPVTLSPGVYHLGYASDSAALALYGAAANLGILNAQGNSLARYFTTNDTVTGDNGTLAMPAACTGTRTAIGAAVAFDAFVIFPN